MDQPLPPASPGAVPLLGIGARGIAVLPSCFFTFLDPIPYVVIADFHDPPIPQHPARCRAEVELAGAILLPLYDQDALMAQGMVTRAEKDEVGAGVPPTLGAWPGVMALEP